MIPAKKFRRRKKPVLLQPSLYDIEDHVQNMIDKRLREMGRDGDYHRLEAEVEVLEEVLRMVKRVVRKDDKRRDR